MLDQTTNNMHVQKGLATIILSVPPVLGGTPENWSYLLDTETPRGKLIITNWAVIFLGDCD